MNCLYFALFGVNIEQFDVDDVLFLSINIPRLRLTNVDCTANHMIIENLFLKLMTLVWGLLFQ